MVPPMSFTQTVKPVVGEELVRPSLMVPASTSSAQPRSLSQYTAQPTANPPVQVLVHVPMTMPKVSEPPLQRRTQRPDDERQAVPVRASCLRSDAILHLVQAFPPRQPQVAAECVAQKVESYSVRASTIFVLVGCSVKPFSSTHAFTFSKAPFASSRLRHRITKSSA